MSQQLDHSAPTTSPATTSGSGLAALVKAELASIASIKMARTGALLGLSLSLLALIAMVLIQRLTDLLPEIVSRPGNLAVATVGAAELMVPFAAIALLTTEWSDGSIRSRLLVVPHRTRLLAAKFIAASCVGIACAAFLAISCFIAIFVIDAPVTFAEHWRAALRVFIAVSASSIWAAAVAAPIRRVAPAVITYLLLVFLVPTMQVAVAFLAIAQDIPWLNTVPAAINITLTLTSWSELSATDPWWVGIICVVIIVVLPLALAARLWKRADL